MRLVRILLLLLYAAGLFAGGYLLLRGLHILPAPETPAAEEPPALSVSETVESRTLKDSTGQLFWVSNVPLSMDAGLSGSDPEKNEALRAFARKEGCHTVAVLSALRDDGLAAFDPSLALLRQSGSPWRDSEGLRWLDPDNPQVQRYLIGLCRELAEMGFDEIQLTDLHPAPGEPLRQSADPETLLRRVQGAVADFDVVVTEEGFPSL